MPPRAVAVVGARRGAVTPGPHFLKPGRTWQPENYATPEVAFCCVLALSLQVGEQSRPNCGYDFQEASLQDASVDPQTVIMTEHHEDNDKTKTTTRTRTPPRDQWRRPLRSAKDHQKTAGDHEASSRIPQITKRPPGHHGPIASRQAADFPFHLNIGWQLSNNAASASSHATAPGDIANSDTRHAAARDTGESALSTHAPTNRPTFAADSSGLGRQASSTSKISDRGNQHLQQSSGFEGPPLQFQAADQAPQQQAPSVGGPPQTSADLQAPDLEAAVNQHLTHEPQTLLGLEGTPHPSAQQQHPQQSSPGFQGQPLELQAAGNHAPQQQPTPNIIRCSGRRATDSAGLGRHTPSQQHPQHSSPGFEGPPLHFQPPANQAGIQEDGQNDFSSIGGVGRFRGRKVTNLLEFTYNGSGFPGNSAGRLLCKQKDLGQSKCHMREPHPAERFSAQTAGTHPHTATDSRYLEC